MYVPPHAREDRRTVLNAAIDDIGFGTLVTVAGDTPMLTQLPMLRRVTGAEMTIVGHVARANPQWHATSGTSAVASFVGPSFYVSPNVYETKRETGRVVPTWNYIAVEASGSIEFFDESTRLHELIRSLTDRHEASQARPWAVDDAPSDFIASQLRGIVGFTLRVERLVGAWKMTLDKSVDDRVGVASAMSQNDDPAVRTLADFVRGGGK